MTTTIKTLATDPKVKNAHLASCLAELRNITALLPVCFVLPPSYMDKFSAWLSKVSLVVAAHDSTDPYLDVSYMDYYDLFAYLKPLDENFNHEDALSIEFEGEDMFDFYSQQVALSYLKLESSFDMWLDENDIPRESVIDSAIASLSDLVYQETICKYEESCLLGFTHRGWQGKSNVVCPPKVSFFRLLVFTYVAKKELEKVV